jgi:hypothetical protein
VVLPVATVCDGLGLDADALADAVRRRLPFVTTAAMSACAPIGRQPLSTSAGEVASPPRPDDQQLHPRNIRPRPWHRACSCSTAEGTAMARNVTLLDLVNAVTEHARTDREVIAKEDRK